MRPYGESISQISSLLISVHPVTIAVMQMLSLLLSGVKSGKFLIPRGQLKWSSSIRCNRCSGNDGIMCEGVESRPGAMRRGMDSPSYAAFSPAADVVLRFWLSHSCSTCQQEAYAQCMRYWEHFMCCSCHNNRSPAASTSLHQLRNVLPQGYASYDRDYLVSLETHVTTEMLTLNT